MDSVSRMLEGKQQEFLDRMTAKDQATKDAANNGELLQAGFNSLSELVIDPDTPQEEVEKMQLVWMSGAQYLWAAVMSTMDDGDKMTSGDMDRFMMIKAELDFWQQDLTYRLSKAQRDSGHG